MSKELFMTTRRGFLKAAGVTVAAISLPAFGIDGKNQPAKPNIVFIFIDDMGYGDIGPFGSTLNKTPHLDRMAKEGVTFTDFYVSSTPCTPSRSALMTGCYADRVGMDGRVLWPGDKRGLNPKEITIPKILKSKGYATGCFGKWHLGDQREFMPLSQGFDEYTGIPYSNDMWPFYRRVKCPPLPFVKAHKVVAHIPDGKNQALLCDVVTDAAVDFIKRHKDERFFAYVPHSYVHKPHFTLKDRQDKAGGELFRAQVEEVDASVGRIMNTLPNCRWQVIRWFSLLRTMAVPVPARWGHFAEAKGGPSTKVTCAFQPWPGGRGRSRRDVLPARSAR